jgi:MFS family permease
MILSGIRGYLPKSREVWFFLLYSAAFHIGLLGLADVVLNFYFVSLGHDSEVIGVLQSLPRLAGLLTSIPIALLANRVGVHRMILWSTVGVVGTMFLKVLVPILPVLGMAQFLQGFFYGAQQIMIAPLMIALVPAEGRTRFFAFHNVVAMATMAFGSFIGGRTPALMVELFRGVAPAESTLNAQTPFAYAATICVSAVVVFAGLLPFLYVRNGRLSVQAAKDKTTREAIPWAYLTFLALPMLTFGFTGGLTFPFYNLFFRTRFGLPDETVGTILSIGWMGMAIVPLLNPFWEKRYGRAWALGLTMTIASIAFWVMGAAPTLIICVVAFTLAISFRNVMQPLYQPLVLDHLPTALHNVASSMSMVMWNTGWFAATIISGFWQKTYGFGFIMTVVAVGVFITGAMVVLIFHNRRAYEVRQQNI